MPDDGEEHFARGPLSEISDRTIDILFVDRGGSAEYARRAGSGALRLVRRMDTDDDFFFSLFSATLQWLMNTLDGARFAFAPLTRTTHSL